MAERAPDIATDALTDGEILRCIATTVREVLLPALRDDADWPRAAAIQLAGLAHYAATRGPDQTPARVAELASSLDALAGNEIVAEAWTGDRSTAGVMEGVGAALAAAIRRDDAAAIEVREVLRPVVVRHLDDELAETTPLVDAFRGNLGG